MEAVGARGQRLALDLHVMRRGEDRVLVGAAAPGALVAAGAEPEVGHAVGHQAAPDLAPAVSARGLWTSGLLYWMVIRTRPMPWVTEANWLSPSGGRVRPLNWAAAGAAESRAAAAREIRKREELRAMEFLQGLS